MATQNTIKLDLENCLSHYQELGQDLCMIQKELSSLQDQKKFKFKVGKWYKNTNYDAIIFFRIYKIEEDSVFYDNSNEFGLNIEKFDIGSTWANQSCLATPEEIQDHLISIAKSKGFKGGLKLHPVNTYCADYIYIENVDKWKYYSGIDKLRLNDTSIYEKGRWAEIIPDKKKLPKTKEEFYKFCEDLFQNENRRGKFDEIINFLNEYED
jgi:hypothetical protein